MSELPEEVQGQNMRCPRCGMSGSRIVEKRGNREYVYYVHYIPELKKKRKCYIGPLSGYVLVERMHTLELDNIETVDYFLVALNALKNYVKRVRKEAEERPQMRNELLAKVNRLLNILTKLKHELEAGEDLNEELEPTPFSIPIESKYV